MTKQITENIYMVNNNGEKNAQTHNEILKSNTKQQKTDKYYKLTVASIIKEIKRFPFSQTTDVGAIFLAGQFNHQITKGTNFLTQQFFL